MADESKDETTKLEEPLDVESSDEDDEDESNECDVVDEEEGNSSK